MWTSHGAPADSRFALGLFAEASSKPDCGASGNYVQIMLKSNVDEFQVAVFKLVAGAETDTITAFTGGFAFVAAPEYLGIQKKGTSYFFWLYWGSGMRELCGVATHASTMQYVGYTMRGQADAVTPSASFMQADFVRFVDNTTVYQP
jgi:hypothetical protein